MGFGDLKTEAGLKALDDFLADKSYIEGYMPSAADAAVFGAIDKAPGASTAHALRWYNHIQSYGNDSAKFPGIKKAIGTYGPKGAAPAADEDDSDDDLDLFGSDDEDAKAELAKIKEERVAAYNAKKTKTEEAPKAPTPKVEADDDDFDLFGDDDDRDANIYDFCRAKPVLIAKSSIILDVKPWDDETDMAEMERLVRAVEADGLVWGASKLVPVGYGIKKLQIICVVEDDKIGTDFLEERITAFEDLVQSMDIAAFNKI